MNMQGDPIELKWNRKDLESLQVVVNLVEKRKVVLQAGGCLGVFPKYLAGKFDRVYTFEPSPSLFPIMVANAPEPNIIRFQAALGDKRMMVVTKCELRPNDGKTVLHPGMTYCVASDKGTVPVMRIDDLELDDCNLLYLDIEGWELYALQGAKNTIERHKPMIVCEVNRGIEYFGLRQDDVRNYMRLIGYKYLQNLRSDEVYVPC